MYSGNKRKKKPRKFQPNKKFDNGAELEEDVQQYFNHLYESLNDLDYDNDEDTSIITNNVLKECNENLSDLFRNRMSSFVLDKVLDYTEPKELMVFLNGLMNNMPAWKEIKTKEELLKERNDLLTISKDKYGSRLMEKIFKLIPGKASSSTGVHPKGDPTLVLWDFLIEGSILVFGLTPRTTTTGKDEAGGGGFMEEGEYADSFLQCVYHPCLCHVGRSGWESLNEILRSGLGTDKEEPPLSEGSIREREEKTKEILVFIGKMLTDSIDLKEMSSCELGSGFLQIVLISLGKWESSERDDYKKELISIHDGIVGKLLEEVFPKGEGNEGDETEEFFASMPLTMLLESAVESSHGETLEKIRERVFAKRLTQLSLGRKSNLTVQKLIRSLKEKSEFESIFDEISPKIEEIISLGYRGVVYELSRGCLKFETKQGDFMKQLAKSYGCSSDPSVEDGLTLKILKEFKRETEEKNYNARGYEEDYQLDLQGSLLLQSLFKFKKPIKFVNGFLSIETSELIKILSHRNGSYLMEAFVQSGYIGEKSRERIFKKLKGSLTDLAISKNGSYAFESLWSVSREEWRISIGEELLREESKLSKTHPGRLIGNKLDLKGMRRDKASWVKEQGKATKTEEKPPRGMETAKGVIIEK